MRTPAQGAPARQHLHLDDHQRHGGDAAARSTSRWRRSRASRARSSAAPSRTTSSRSTSRAAPTSTRRAPSLRLITDIFAFAGTHVPSWNTISISGYHIREAGCDAIQEVAFTLADGIAYVEAAIKAGLDVDGFGAQLSFFFNVHNNVLEEVAKFRAARRLWCAHHGRALRREDRSRPRPALPLPDGGHDAHRPAADGQRGARRAPGLAAVLGGCQSLHTNSYDEALGLPTSEAVTIALRTQQIDRVRVGRGRLRRPARGQLRGGERSPTASRRARASTCAASTSWAAWSPPSSRATCSARSRPPPTATSSRSRTSSASWWGRTSSSARRPPCR